MSYFIYKETCFAAPVECYERGGNTTYEQASNSKQKPTTKYAVQEIHASTSNPTIKDTISENDDWTSETNDSFSVSKITNSVIFPAISDSPSAETTDSVSFPVISDFPIPDSVSIPEIAHSPTLPKDSFIPGNADSQPEISQKSDCNNWIESVAALSCIGNYTNECQALVNDARKSDIPNIEQWIEEARNTVTLIQENCGRFIEKSATILQDIQRMKPKVNDSDPAQVSVDLLDHDPALRGEVRDDNQREYLVELGPCRPRLSCFPTNPDIPQGKQNRFSPRWYDEYPHLEYSVEKDAVFCFVCSLFDDTPSKEKADPSWKTTGIRKWHKMKSVGKSKQGKLVQHFSSQSHKASLGAYCHFLQKTKHIDIQLDKAKRAAQIQEAQDLEYNRQIIFILLDVAKTLARQALPFRGDSNEDGNFYQVVLLLSRHVPNLKRWLSDKRLNPYHVTYLSPQSQNEFITLLEKELRGKVIEEVKRAGMFSVMADTTPDEEHTDRLSVVLRYVNDTGKPTERLLDLSKTEDKTGPGQAQDILSTITRCGLNTDSLCFQSYDFAAAMSGEFNGAQKNLLELVGRDIPYIPCQAHRCNTVIKHSCNASVIVTEMFEILQALYVFFTSSTKRFQPLKDEIVKVENCLMLRNQSKTRWSARAESIQAVWTSFEVILDVLHTITNKADVKTKTQALGLKKKMLSLDFVVALMFMKNIAYKTKSLVVQLQSVELNILDATGLVYGTLGILQKLRDDDKMMDDQIEASVIFASNIEIDAEADFNRHHRPRKAPRRVDEQAGTATVFSLQAYYRNQFREVLDVLTSRMKEHLVQCQKSLLPLLKCLTPPIDGSEINSAASLFPPSQSPDALAVEAELQVLAELLPSDIGKDYTNVVEVSKANKLSLPLANSIIRLMLTAPVTVASNERSFSQLKFVKNKLRTSMKDARLTGLMLLTCEKDLTGTLNLEKVARECSLLKKRRVAIF